MPTLQPRLPVPRSTTGVKLAGCWCRGLVRSRDSRSSIRELFLLRSMLYPGVGNAHRVADGEFILTRKRRSMTGEPIGPTAGV